MWFIIAVALIVVGYLVWRANESSDGTNDERPQRARSSGRAGYVGGRHFTSYVETVKSLKRESRYDEALDLLKRLIAATEAESSRSGMGVAPWYYEEAAKIYRRRKDYEQEVMVLERYMGKVHAPGASKPRLLE
ncbi:hypothetical protein KAT84_00455, partial [Candidatus Bipolaricaulota bacterium]|nr:hypothetical protein [Candidatus Bipolaricaulota bacterium]